MRRHELAVEQVVTAGLHPRDQPGERNLRCIGHSAEHAFAEEGASELHAVKPTHQFAAVKDLDRMGVPRRVKGQHGALDIGVDPRLFPVGAGSDDRSKVTVQRN